MPKNSLRLGLFDPGMTHLHRVGLAGLHMTLSRLDAKKPKFKGASWILDENRIQLDFEEGYPFFEWLFEKSFKVSTSGLIDFPSLRSVNMGDKEEIIYHNSVLNTFLQHPKTTDKGKETDSILDFEDKKVVVGFKPLKWYYLQGKKPSWPVKATAPTLEMLFDKKRRFKEQIQMKGLHFPGAVERHSGLTGTAFEQSPGNLICLLFAPTASLYYQMAHKGPDGKFDKKLRTAIVLPHVADLKTYSQSFQRYLDAPVTRLSANSLGDAGLAALVELKAKEDLGRLGISGCTVVSMGNAKWSDKQKTRTKVFSISQILEERIVLFDIAARCLPNRVIFIEKKKNEKADRFFVATSVCRGLIADNIAAGHPWFKDFHCLMRTQKQSEQIRFERKGLNDMTEKAVWTHEADKLLVESIHHALRHRYGMIAKRAQERGETIPFDREFERIRTSLMRAKNLHTMRAELADIFARGGNNATLKENWAGLLPLFTGPDWQRARDLALLALASYARKEDEDNSEFDEGYDDETEEDGI